MARTLRALALAGLLVLSLFAGVGGSAASVDTVAQPQQANEQADGQGLSGPPGQAPDSHTNVSAVSVRAGGPGNGQGGPSSLPPNVPDHAAAWDVTTTHHAGTLSADIVVGNGSVQLNVTDDENHVGRMVGINASAVVAAEGSVPEVAQIRNLDTGEEWVVDVQYHNGRALVEVPHFSTNTVTFGGSVSVTGNPASDGSKYNYNISNIDNVNNFDINVSGSLNRHSETMTASAVADGGSVPLDVAGNLEPVGPGANGHPVVTLTGNGFVRSDSASGTTLSNGQNISLGVDGNLPPQDGSVTLTGNGFVRSDSASATTLSDGQSVSLEVDGNLDPNETSVTLTGNGFQRWSNVSATGLSDGGTVGLDVAGNLAPTGPSANSEPTVTFNGVGFGSRWDNSSATGVDPSSYSTALDVDGSIEPTNGSGGNPALAITAHGGESIYSVIDDSFDGTREGWRDFIGDVNSDAKLGLEASVYPSTSGSLQNVTVNITSPTGSDYGAVADVYLESGEVDGSPGKSTLIKDNWDPSWSEGPQTFSVSAGSVEAGKSYHLEFYTQNSDGDGSGDHIHLVDDGSPSSIQYYTTTDGGSGSYTGFKRAADIKLGINGEVTGVSADSGSATASFGDFADGETKTKQLDISPSAESLNISATSGYQIDYKLTLMEKSYSDSPGLDIDGDGTDEASTTQNLKSGESVTKELSTLSTSDDSGTVSLADGTVDVDVSFKERKASKSPGVDIDGDGTAEASTTQNLFDGETWTGSLSSLSTSTSSATVLSSGGQTDVSVSWTERKASKAPGVDLDGDGVAENGTSQNLYQGETWTGSLSSLSTSTSSATVLSSGGQTNVSVSWTERKASKAPGLDIDGDGTHEVATTQNLFSGETYSEEVSSLSLSDDSGTVAVGGDVDVEVDLTERTQTVDPVIEVNGNRTSYSGALNDSESVSLSTNEAWVREGINRINVSASPGLSADAPTPQVGLSYSHSAESVFSVDYGAYQWKESYNASKTYSSTQSSASMAVTFVDNVVAIGELKTRVNGGTWSTVSSSDYSLDGNKLSVDLGGVSKGDSVEVRVSGHKVQSSDGDIKVVEPTALAEDLSTKIEIDNVGNNFKIRVSNTSNRIHYLSNPSWSADEFARVSPDGTQSLHADPPNGSAAYVRRVPLEVQPEEASVKVRIDDPTGPHFRITGAPSSDVRVGYYDTVPGETYALTDLDADEVISTDTAESPVWFLVSGADHNYSVSLYESGSGGGDGGPGFGGGATSVSGLPVGTGLLLVIVAALMLGMLFVGRRYLGFDGLMGTTVLAVGGFAITVISLEAVSGVSLLALVFEGSSSAGTVILGLGSILLLYIVDETTGIDIEQWIWVVVVAGIGIWLVDDVTGGSLGDGLSQVSPLIWILVVGGALILGWQALKPDRTILKLGGRLK